MEIRRSRELLQNALLLNPNYLTARIRYSLLLVNLERFSEALDHINKIISLDPISTLIIFGSGDCFTEWNNTRML